MRRIKIDPDFDASKEDWSEFDDRIVEDTQEGRVTIWLFPPADDDPEAGNDTA